MTDETPTPDRALMLALQTGDRAALAELYDRHATRLHTFLVRWTGDAAAAEDLLHDLEALEGRERLEDALGRLSPGHREVILLRTDLDMSHRELAAELGRSEGAARVRLHRALAELRRHWTQEVGHA